MLYAMARFAARLVLALGATVGLLAAGAAESGRPNDGAWNDYIYSADAFAISAPVAPTLEKQKVRIAGGSFEAHVYTVPGVDNGAFVVFVVMRDASDQRSDREVLDEARIGALRAANAIVIVQSNITLGPYRGSQLDLDTQSGEAAGKNKRIRDRFFVVGRRLYQLMAVAPAGEPLPVGTGRWFDSFRLVGEGAR
jgi:hypothetical protein